MHGGDKNTGRKLALRVRIGERILVREVSSWDELTRLKNGLKSSQDLVFNSATKTWSPRGMLAEEFKEKLVEVFGLTREEAEKIVREYNEAYIKRLEEKVRGTGKIIPLEYLGGELFRTIKKYAEWSRGEGVFKVSPDKIAQVHLEAKSLGELEEAIRKWVESLRDKPLVFDEEYLLEKIVEEAWGIIVEAKTVKAELFLEKGKAEKKWIKLVFSPKLPRNKLWEVKDKLRENRVIPYKFEVFEEGEKKLKEVEIYSVKLDKNEPQAVYIAPFKYVDAKKTLAEQGFIIREEGFKEPPGEPELSVPDIRDRLRDYQREALEKWVENKYRGVIQIPTGGGKTWIGLAGIGLLKTRTVVFVPTINLALQWRDMVKRILGVPSDKVGILGGGFNELGKPVLIATYDSGVRYAWEIAQRYPFYIYDEGHHVGADTFKEIAWSSLAPYRMVLSATVERDDGNEELIYAMCGGKVYEISFYELVEQGFLAPVKIEFITVPLPGEEEKKYQGMLGELEALKEEFKKVYDKYKAKAIAEGYADVKEYLRRTGNPEYKKLNSRALSLRQRMRILEQRNPNKKKIAVELADEHIGKGNKVFVFTNLEDQAREIYEELRKRHGGKVALIIGKTSTKERDVLFRLFREGRVKCIVTTTVLDEGIDAPDSDVAIVVSSRAIRHPRQFIQRIGRIVRPKEGKTSYVYILRTAGGVEEATITGLKEALNTVYNLDKMAEKTGGKESSSILDYLNPRGEESG